MQGARVHFSTNPTDLLNTLNTVSLREDQLVRLLGGLCFSARATPFADIQRVMPGEEVSFGPQLRPSFRSHSLDSMRPVRRTLEDVASELRDLISSFAASRLSEARKVTVLLSGGIDSSVMAFEFAQLAQVEAIHLVTSSVDALSIERSVAGCVARRLGIELHEIDDADFPRRGFDLDRHLTDLRSERGNCLPLTYFLDDSYLEFRRLADSGTRLGTSGLFGDLIFPPAPWWMANRWRQFIETPRTLWHLFAQPGLPIEPGNVAYALSCFFLRKAAYDPSFDTPNTLTKFIRRGSRAAQLLEGFSGGGGLDSEWSAEYTSGPLARVDTVDPLSVLRFERSGHVPAPGYASRALLEFGASLRREVLQGKLFGETFDKLPLRFAYSGRLPVSVTGRRQTDAYAGVQDLLFRRYRTLVQELLGKSSILVDLGIVDYRAVQDHMDSTTLEQSTVERDHLYTAASIEAWLRFALASESAETWLHEELARRCT